MKEPQILSVFHDAAATSAENAAPQPVALVFDACHVGVVLRAVLFVQAVMAVATMFGAATVLDWLARLSLVTGAALPATLLWLIVACVFKKLLARLPHTGQQAAGIALGALAGLYGCAMLAWSGLQQQPAP